MDSTKHAKKPGDLEIVYLKDHPQWLNLLADWICEGWSRYDASLTQERSRKLLNERLHDDRLPMTLVAVEHDQPIGVGSLKAEEFPEFEEFAPPGSPWLGGLYAPDKQEEVKKAILMKIKKVAHKLGHQEVYAYSSNPQDTKWYLNEGATELAQKQFRGHTVTVFKLIC